MTGVTKYEVNLEAQTADVQTNADVEYATVLEKIKKTGKVVKAGSADGKAMAV